MSDTKFTPGKWESVIRKRGDYTSVIVYLPNGGFCIEQIPDAEANAYLIAAAPDMYKALEEMIESMESDFAPGYGSEWHIKAIRALGKARGES